MKILFIFILTTLNQSFVYTHGRSDSLTTNLKSKQRISVQHIRDNDKYMRDQVRQIENFDTIPSPIEATLNHEKALRKQHKIGVWGPLRILTDFINMDPLQSYASLIRNKFIPPAISYISQAFSVFPKPKISELVGKLLCSKYVILPFYSTQLGIPFYDLVLFVGTADGEGENWFVRTAPCAMDLMTKRPVAGVVEFNYHYLANLDFSNVSATTWQHYIQLTIHEITHLLGFSSSLYNSYLDPTTNLPLGISQIITQSAGRSWVTLPGVVAEARTYFGCNALWGVPLENNDDDENIGSHWESTTFGNEAMTGSQMAGGSVFSRFTFKMLEGSGWYLANYNFVQPFIWGSNEGCAFAVGQCNSSSLESCPPHKPSCSVDYMGPAGCALDDPLVDGCVYLRELVDLDCRQYSLKVDSIVKSTGGIVGSSARCWVTTLPKVVGLTEETSCYVSLCTGKNELQVTVGDSIYYCTKDEQVINIVYKEYKATITCPNIQRFCALQNLCPGSCSGRGTCVANTCICGAGFSGVDCSQYPH